MQEGFKSTEVRSLNSWGGALTAGTERGDISLAASPCSHWPSKADFLVPSRRGAGTVSPILWSHSLYIPFVEIILLWMRVSTLTFYMAQSSWSTYKPLKSPQNCICTIRLFKHVFSSGLSIFSSKQEVLIFFVAFGCPRSRGLALPRELDTLHTFVSGKEQCPIVSKAKRVKGKNWKQKAWRH